MKKLIPLIFTSVFPSFALAAEALMCRQSYDIFNQQFADQKHFIETKDIAGYLRFNQKITYSESGKIKPKLKIWLNRSYPVIRWIVETTV